MPADTPAPDNTVRPETIMGHQLRTPLTDILGMAHLLDDTTLEKDQKEYVQAIMRASHELLVRVDNSLDLAQLSDDALGVQEEHFSITEALLEMVERMRPSAATKNLDISLEFAPDISTKIHCDKARLAQAVYNLTAHLIAQYKDGALRMTATIKEDQWGDTLCITITAGAQACQPATVDAPSTEALDITRRLARLMGGEVSFDSEEDELCCGQLSIRVDKDESDNEPAPRSARILVAEDSRANQRLIGLILNKLGHEFELVADGIEAIAAAKASRFDMILMDVHMPRMDGMEACQKIRELEDNTAALVPVIALTADVRPQMRTKVLEAGMNAYLTKPLDVAKLEDTIQKCLNMPRTHPERFAKTA